MKSVGIEALLRWAYVDELPHGDVDRDGPVTVRSNWSGMSMFLELLTNVDRSDLRNIYGLAPTRMEREPHPDAIAVFDAVTSLEGALCFSPPAWNPLADMGDLGDLGAAAVARGLARLTVEGSASRLRRPVVALVLRQALTGAIPEWEAEPVRVQPVLVNGKPAWFRRLPVIEDGAFGPVEIEVEVDGYDSRRRRPYSDAYRKSALVPDPTALVVERAEHELWHAALVHLTYLLAPVLTAHRLNGPALDARPWQAHPPMRSEVLGLVLRDG